MSDSVEAEWYSQHGESKVLRKFDDIELGRNHRPQAVELDELHAFTGVLAFIFVTRWQ